MKAQPSRCRVTAAALSLSIALALAACDSGPSEHNKADMFPVVGPAAPSAATSAAMPPAAAQVPSHDQVPSAPLPVRKDFIDPPLPPELEDDGGLEPLPPRPVVTANP